MSEQVFSSVDPPSSAPPQTLSEIQNKISSEEAPIFSESKVTSEMKDAKIEIAGQKNGMKLVEGLDNLKPDGSLELSLGGDSELRKESLKEGECNLQDIEESEEYDVRRKIN